ncbi:MAG: CBASS cGAMP-activated phospholipase [Bacteroidota bacterium]
MESRKYYRILSLDGGGIRGLLTCRLLEKLETYSPGFISKFDLFAGTSTGGILALGLAAGFSPGEMARIYVEKGDRIFAKGFWDHLGDLDRFIDSDYDNKALKQALEDQFGKDRTLDQLPRNVLISSFCLDSGEGSEKQRGVRSWKAKFFQNFLSDESDCKQKVVDVALRTSAAPTYFPLYDNFADGGLVANNPSMCALAQAVDCNTGKQSLENIVMLSVGTGATPKWLDGGNAKWGYVQWAPNLISIMMDGVSGVADFQCRQLLNNNEVERYKRVNVNFPEMIGLDDVRKETIGYLNGQQNYRKKDGREEKAWPSLFESAVKDTQLDLWLDKYFTSAEPAVRM